MDIGTKLKSLRTQNGLTQQELADRAELTKGFISQVERNLTSPSISTLADILQCLGSSLQEFFTDDTPEQIVFREEDYFLKDDPELGHQIEWLVPNAQKNQMEPIRMTLAPRGRSCIEPPHVGEEMGYVLEGNILLTLGKKTYRVQKGETFYFPANQEHWLEGETMSNRLIDLQHITKIFDGEKILDDLNLYIRENEFLTLLGPSGCGKTTTLRIIGGFLFPDKGNVIFDGKDITQLAPNKRQLNTVFQKYALFPNMNVAENIAFGLKIKKKSKAYIDDKIKYALKLVNLDGYEKRKIDALSGGQQQRIAIARAIVNEPKVLLLDEPLGALDLKMRQDMQYELIRLKNELGITFVYVTHDQEEALTMSDTIVVMNGGYIQQIGTPEDIYNEPQNAFVADFIGDSNLFGATMIQDRLVEILGAKFLCVDEGFGTNNPVDVVIRPEDVELVEPEVGIIKGRVTSVIFKGVHYEMTVMANGFEWLVHSTDMYPVDREVGIFVKPFNIQIMHKPESDDEKAVDINE